MPLHLAMIDDDPFDRLLMKKALAGTAPSMTITEFGCGELALNSVEADEWDAILLDAKMPYLDGYEMLEMMRQRPGWERIPIIMISASHRYEEIVRATACGATGFFPKPSTLDGYQRLAERLYEEWFVKIPATDAPALTH